MNRLQILTSPVLRDAPGVRHAFFTRRGGVSVGVYESLNVGVGSRDYPAAVRENRRLAAASFGRSEESLITAYQIHSAIAVHVVEPGGGEPALADAVVSGGEGLMLGVLSADCAPILLVDPTARVVAAAHAGWRGALSGIVEATVELMVQRGARRSRLLAAIGPCIGPSSYEVGLDFLAAFEAASPRNLAFFGAAARPDKRLFDLPAYVLSRLAAAGVDHADWIGRDTWAEPGDFFSNRRAVNRGDSDYGRLLSAVMLVPA